MLRKPKADEALTPEDARLSAMRLLGRREHSARELVGKLKQRGVEADDAVALVNELAEDGWQSDPRYAEKLVRHRITQGYGPLRIRAELAMAKLDEALIREALETADCDWAALAVQVHARKFGAPPANLAERQKRYRALAQRGFAGDQIRAALQGEADHDE